MSEQTRVSNLTPSNVQAIRETLRPLIEQDTIEVHKTYAVFRMSKEASLAVVQDVIKRTPGRGHPKASLYAVARKLATDQDPGSVEEATEEGTDITAQPSNGQIDPAALFLTELHYPNMFELHHRSNGTHYYMCKVCGTPVKQADWEKHHASHKGARANQVAEKIRERKESSMADKAPKIKPSDQGIPAVYLNEEGSKFKPGADASLKRDLIAAIDGLDNPNGLHTFDAAEAAKILAARDWNAWLVKSRANREAKAARAAAKKDKAKTTAKTKAQTKKAAASLKPSDEVTPDPKPQRARRSTRRVRS